MLATTPGTLPKTNKQAMSSPPREYHRPVWKGCEEGGGDCFECTLKDCTWKDVNTEKKKNRRSK